MIDPKIMNKVTEDMASRGEILNPKNQTGYNPKMDDLSDYEEFIPPDNLPGLMMQDDSDFDYNQQSNSQSFAPDSQFRQSHDMPYSEPARPDMPFDYDDQRIFPGGPLQSELESLRKQYGDIWVVDDLPTDQIYIYRDMTRYEYKAIMATPNTDPLMREELICEQCVLFPYDLSYAQMSNGKAGVVTVLAQHIMETSGFTKASMPRRL